MPIILKELNQQTGSGRHKCISASPRAHLLPRSRLDSGPVLEILLRLPPPQQPPLVPVAPLLRRHLRQHRVDDRRGNFLFRDPKRCETRIGELANVCVSVRTNPLPEDSHSTWLLSSLKRKRQKKHFGSRRRCRQCTFEGPSIVFGRIMFRQVVSANYLVESALTF